MSRLYAQNAVTCPETSVLWRHGAGWGGLPGLKIISDLLLKKLLFDDGSGFCGFGCLGGMFGGGLGSLDSMFEGGLRVVAW